MKKKKKANNTEDVDEFMKISSSKSKKTELLEVKNEDGLAKITKESALIEEIPNGKYIQYTFNGSGFSPVSKTIQTLPVGCYKPSISKDILTFESQNIVTDALLRLPDSKSDQVVLEIQEFWKLKKRF